MKYIDAERLKAEIERFIATEYGDNTLEDDVVRNAFDYVFEEIIPSLQQKTEEEQRKRNDEMRKTSIEYRDSVIKHIEAKRALPSFKGQLLHDFKNELNTMEQILNIRMWSEIQYAIFEKVALNFAAWGGYHFHPGKPQTEDSLQQEQPEVDLEKEIDAVWNPRFNLGWDEKSLLSINHSAFETIAHHFYELGLNARKED